MKGSKMEGAMETEGAPTEGCVVCLGVSACTRLKTCLLGLHAICRVDLFFLFLERRPAYNHAIMACSDVATSSPSISLPAYYKHGKEGDTAGCHCDDKDSAV
jgi:hypothetical protein